MTSKYNRPGDVAEMRRRSEEIAREEAAQPPERLKVLSPEETQRTLHELRVHQIELEMQNEELRLAQAELDAARARYFDLYDRAPVGYVTVSEKGLILETNLTATTLLGGVRGALAEQPFSRFILKEDQDLYSLHRNQLFETHSASSGQVGEPQAFELRMVKRDGTAFWGHLAVTAAQDADRAPVCRVVMSDITERKRAEAALLESEQRVRQLNEHILNMVMVLSHDIRGPLVAIASILKLMLRGAYGKLDQSPANTVQDLLTRCARLLGTAEDYLGKASIVMGSIELERQVLDLRQDIIDAVLEELADDITRHEIVIDNCLGAIPAGSIVISANKTWLKAVYRNLFTNAVKYGGNGCTISFGFEQRESHYRLNVYNSGRPIAKEDREKLFIRFGRIGSLEGHTPDGVGLGLCLSREIILEHGGEIWYEALPDGSNFVFTISREDECRAVRVQAH
jgi:PAS domain S-box-containing protein